MKSLGDPMIPHIQPCMTICVQYTLQQLHSSFSLSTCTYMYMSFILDITLHMYDGTSMIFKNASIKDCWSSTKHIAHDLFKYGCYAYIIYFYKKMSILQYFRKFMPFCTVVCNTCTHKFVSNASFILMHLCRFK